MVKDIMTTEQILKVLKAERECIKRPYLSNDGKPILCFDKCSDCPNYLPDDEKMEVLDFLINGYELLQDKGADEYTIRCKEPLSKEQIERFKEEWGKATFTASFEPISLPDNLKMIIQGDTE